MTESELSQIVSFRVTRSADSFRILKKINELHLVHMKPEEKAVAQWLLSVASYFSALSDETLKKVFGLQRCSR